MCVWAEEDLTWTAAAPEARYTDIILYVSGSLALVVLLLLAGLYRGQVLLSRHPRQPATVQKLSRFPLARQVPCCSPPPTVSPIAKLSACPPPPQLSSSRLTESPTFQFSLESGSSAKSSSSLVRGVRLSSSGPPLLAGLVSLDLPLDPLWEFPRDRYAAWREDGHSGSRQEGRSVAEALAVSSPGWCSGSRWVRAALGRWCVQRPSAWTPPSLTKPALWPSKCSRVSGGPEGHAVPLGPTEEAHGATGLAPVARRA